MSVEEAVKSIEIRYNMEIEDAKKANPHTMAAWEKDWSLQKKLMNIKKEWQKNPCGMDSESFLPEVLPGERDA